MYGGFINSLTPFNYHKIDQLLFVTHDIIQNFDHFFHQLLLLNQIKSDKFKLDVSNIKQLISDFNHFLSIYNIDLHIDFYPDLRIFKDKLKLISKDLSDLRKNYDILTKINCHIKDINPDCLQFNPVGSNKFADNISSYVAKSFGLLNFQNIFKNNNIHSYIIVKNILGTLYVIYHHNIDIKLNIIPFIFELLDNLSLQRLNSANFQKTQIKFNYFTWNKYILFKNTSKLINSKIYDNEIIKLINDMIKINLHQDLIINIRYLFDKLYRFNKDTNSYMHDTYVFVNNPILFMMFIDKFHVFINLIDFDVISKDLISSHFPSSPHLLFAYNYYYYLTLTFAKNIKMDDINLFINFSETQLYEKFINEIYDIYVIIFTIKNQYNDTEFIKNLLYNFMIKILSLNNLHFFPLNSRLLLEKFTIPIEVNKDQLLTILDNNDDKYFNTPYDFRILESSDKVTYNNINYKDCGENTIFNLLNYLLISKYDEESDKFKLTNDFNFEKIIGTNFEPFYRKYNNYNNLEIEYNKNSSVKSEFAAILSGKLLPIYENEICEIIPTRKNVLDIMNNIMNKTFANLKEFVKYFDINHILIRKDGIEIENENTEEEYTEMKNEYVLDNTIEILLSLNHGYFVLKRNFKNYEYNFFNIMYDTHKNIETIDELDKKKQLLFYTNFYNNNNENIIDIYIKTPEINDNTCIILIDNNNIRKNDEYYYLLILDTIRFGRFELTKHLLDLIKDKNILNRLDDDEYFIPIFYDAILTADIKFINLVLDAGVDITKAKPLECAYYICDSMEMEIDKCVDIIKLLIERGADINAIMQRSDTPIIFKFYSNYNYEIVKLLIDKKADTFYIDKNNEEKSLLITAIILYNNNLNEEEQFNIIKLLIDIYIETRGSINYVIEDDTILNHAILNDTTLKIIKLLLDKGAKINIKEHNSFYAAVSTLSLSGSLDIIKLLIDYGADVNYIDEHKLSPLCIAIEHNYKNIDIVKLLLEHGADVNFSVPYKNLSANRINHTPVNHTPLYVALTYGKNINKYTVDVINLLIQHNADVNNPTYNEYPLLYLAICKYIEPSNEYNRPEFDYIYEIILILLSHTSNINWQNKEGCTLINMIIMRDYPEYVNHQILPDEHERVMKIINLLIKNGININIPTNDPPINIAIINHELDIDNKIIKLLIDNGALIDIGTNLGTPLNLSIDYNLHEYIESITTEKNRSIKKGGYNNYNKYLKYKHKYLNLKKNIIMINY